MKKATDMFTSVYDSSVSWSYYLSRPFNLFEASVWHEWYVSPAFQEIFGAKWTTGLFVECPKGIARQYRDNVALQRLSDVVHNLVAWPERLEEILNTGLDLNKQAELLLGQNTFSDLQSTVDFSARLLHFAATVPYFVGDELGSAHHVGNLIRDKVDKLRQVSYYPKVLEKIILPMGQQRLSELGVKQKGALNVVTYRELVAGDVSNLSSRLALSAAGNSFVFQTIDGEETVSFLNDGRAIVDQIEGESPKGLAELTGIIASSGSAKGKVRLVLGNHVGVAEFNEGDVLVAVSTNPAIVSLMRKASAIVTDEGGLTSHAAIISRELKKPCVIGTKFATRVLKNGDLIEVDANKGTIKKLKEM